MHDTDRMLSKPNHHEDPKVASLVRKRIEVAGERLWRFEDFQGLSGAAVAQALSRLARAGVVQRLSRGVYYRGRATAFGRSLPNPSELAQLATSRRAVFPSGVSAANFLGFSTQNVAQREVATTSPSLPRKLVGAATVVHARRPEAWSTLTEMDAALLDFLRQGGRTSELSEAETLHRTLSLLSERGRYGRLLAVAATEPPRVRALLGALGEQLGKPSRTLQTLHDSLNALSKFDFGVFAMMPSALAWQAKRRGR